MVEASLNGNVPHCVADEECPLQRFLTLVATPLADRPVAIDPPTGEEADGDEARPVGCLPKLMHDYYAPFLLHNVTRAAVLVVLLASIVVGGIGFASLEVWVVFGLHARSVVGAADVGKARGCCV